MLHHRSMVLSDMRQHKSWFSFKRACRIWLQRIEYGKELLVAIGGDTCCIILPVGVRLVLQALSGARLLSSTLAVAVRLFEFVLLCKAAQAAVLRECEE